ncbi:MAG TPA: hypothetical protein VJV21_02105 [Pyrinomonadaceae bacterium]|nr:hypothetical protein [Pyrinomonadaceae bacterium]
MNSRNVEYNEASIREIINAHHDWFMSIEGRSPINLTTDEFEFSASPGRLIFSSWTENGSRVWRVKSWRWKGDRLIVRASRRMGAEQVMIELIPRASAKAIVAGIAAARQERCEKLAELVAQNLVCESASGNHRLKSVPLPKIEFAQLSPGMRRDQPGRYARIVLKLPHERVAVTGTVAESDARNVDSLFSSTLLWFQRILQTPKRPLLQRLLLVVEREILEAARQRHVLLRDSLRERIALFEINDDWTEVTPVKSFERKHIWRKRLARFPPVNEPAPMEHANEILAQLPEAIDMVASRHGQTLRYHGLPFARLRRVMERERIWFGIEGSRRRQLDVFHQQDWAKLLDDLEMYRTVSCRDRRHWLYRAAGEAWLESMLRRDITKLDPGLIIAPLHAQFRTSHGGAFGSAGGARPIDLLALRHDGRLVVIELKVTEDREHVFQGVDYWRRVEAHRRRGHISSAKLFGDREISDESPLVYLVAPTLHFHPSFRTLARTIAPDIEIYRFDINEDWRSGVRVVRREQANCAETRP